MHTYLHQIYDAFGPARMFWGSRHHEAYEIVGPDEVEPARRQISVASPVARALLGKRAGDSVVLRRPRGDIEVTVVSVTVALGDDPGPASTTGVSE